MCRCEFCNRLYTPRPQTKKPRACNNRSCQKARQRENEKAWHNKHKGHYDSQYHSIRKKQRFKILRERTRQLVDFIFVGARFHGRSLVQQVWEEYLFPFFVRLGTKRVNKLWGV